MGHDNISCSTCSTSRHKYCTSFILINRAACSTNLCENVELKRLFIKNVCSRLGGIYAVSLQCKAAWTIRHLWSDWIHLVNLCFLFNASSFPSWNWAFIYDDCIPKLWYMIYNIYNILLHFIIYLLQLITQMVYYIFNMIEILCEVQGKSKICFYVSVFFLSAFVPRDLLRIGVTLAGHQKKILSNIQSMRVQMSQSPTSMAWLQGALCHGTGSIRRTNNNGSLRMTPNPSERARVETIVLI